MYLISPKLSKKFLAPEKHFTVLTKQQMQGNSEETSSLLHLQVVKRRCKRMITKVMLLEIKKFIDTKSVYKVLKFSFSEHGCFGTFNPFTVSHLTSFGFNNWSVNHKLVTLYVRYDDCFQYECLLIWKGVFPPNWKMCKCIRE